MRFPIFLLWGGLCLAQPLLAQNSSQGVLVGGFQSETHRYVEDPLLGTTLPPSAWATNNYLRVDYTRGSFSTGVRYEAYLPPLLGFPTKFKGNGVAFRYARYHTELLDVTVGNFYEQYGSGLVLRAFEERLLGIDNSLDGVRVRVQPLAGLRVSGLYARQRDYQSLSKGYLRAGNVELSLEDFAKEGEKGLPILLGASVVSKFEPYFGVDPKVPEEVLSYAARVAYNGGQVQADAEYVHRESDPSLDNGYIVRPGRALQVNLNWLGEGIGVNVTGRYVDNMLERLQRDGSLQDSWVNYVPAMTKQHQYLLPNIYPYGVQPMGEMGAQATIWYTIPKGSVIGGKYGTKLELNVAQANGLRYANDSIFSNVPPDPLRWSDEVYYQDVNLSIERKMSKKLRLWLNYYTLLYNRKRIEGVPKEDVRSHIVVAEGLFKFGGRKSLKVNVGHLWTQQDRGNWASVEAEFTMAPHWSFFASDLYNYDGIPQVHYYNVGFAYIRESTRISLGYGRQRGGLLCVGGICRLVPEYTGFNMSITTNFAVR